MKREEYTNDPKGYYHLATDGKWNGTIFHTPSQFAYGMIVVGLITKIYAIEVYAFTLMDNHIHILLSGTGRACRDAFYYMVRKLNLMLKKDDFPELPEDYGFKLVSINSLDQLRNNYIYLDRNPYEKGWCVPSAYPWGTAFIHYSYYEELFVWKKAGEMSKRELERITGSRAPIPANWEFNPTLGLNPASFVQKSKFRQLFPTIKAYQSRLIKDYEAFVQVADSLGEEISFSAEDVDCITTQLLRDVFPGKEVRELQNDEKGRLAVIMVQRYQMSTRMVSDALVMPEYLVKQFIHSKDYGKITFPTRL